PARPHPPHVTPMPRRGKSRRQGSAVAEALVAAALAGAALAAIALVARVAGSGLRLARDTNAALAAAESQLEALRSEARGDGGDDVTVDGVRFSRAWSVG